jgi:hypothetical protein
MFLFINSYVQVFSLISLFIVLQSVATSHPSDGTEGDSSGKCDFIFNNNIYYYVIIKFIVMIIIIFIKFIILFYCLLSLVKQFSRCIVYYYYFVLHFEF